MSHLLRVAQMRDECPGRARPWSIFFLPVLGVFFVFSCSGLKLDKESNCRNSQASCFKADKTSPKVQGFSTQPAPDASNYISSLNYFDVTFSEELKDGENKSKYSFIQDASHNFQVSLVQKVSAYTYRIYASGAILTGGSVTLNYSQLTDYGQNPMDTSFSVSRQTTVNVGMSGSVTRNGVSNSVATDDYPSVDVTFRHFFTTDATNNNTWKIMITGGAVDCNTGTQVATGTFLAPNVDQTNTLNAAQFALGINRIVVCVTNQVNVAAQGVASWLIIRDDTAPTTSFTPPADNYPTVQSLTITCTDNADRIIYTSEFQQTTVPADPPAPVFDASGAVTSGSLYTGPLSVANPANPTNWKFSWQCIDVAGNRSPVTSNTAFLIDNTIPLVTPTPDSTFRSFISNAANNSTTFKFTTDQVNRPYKIIRGGVNCADAGATTMVSGTTPAIAGTTITQALNTTTHFPTYVAPATVYDVRICVQAVTSVWGTAYVQITRDDDIPIVTPSATGGNYGATQNVEFSCTNNKDVIAYSVATQLGSAAPTAPADPTFDTVAGTITSGLAHTGPYPTPDQSTTILKYRCLDKSGNQTAVQTVQYTIDASLPSVTFVSLTRTGVSANAGGYASTDLTWTSSRAGLTYRIRKIADCNHAGDPGNTIASGTTPSIGTNVLDNLALASFPTLGTTYPLRICVFNFVSQPSFQPTSLNVTRDDTYPVYAGLTGLNSPASGSFTLTWSAATDAGNSNLAFYRIYQATAPGGPYVTADYTVAAPATNITVTGLNPATTYYFIAGAVDNAGNETKVTAAELASKPAIRLVVSGLSGSFDITDGVASLTVSTNITAPGNMWSTTLAMGQTYNFSITSQPVGQVCAIKEKQFASLVSDLTINVNCVNGYLVGGQNLNTVPAVKLGYRLFQGRNIAVAGSGTPGGSDGTGAAASFNFPEYLTHLNGFLYVADTNTFKIRRIALTGNVVTSLTGTGSNGTGTIADDGVCGSAALGQPMGLATDGTNIYVAEINFGRIRKISDVNGTCRVVTLAGTGTSGYTDGAANVAQFNQPRQIVANNSYLYVADSVNNRIRRVSLSTGIVDTLAGNGVASDANGTGTAAGISAPIGLALINTTLYASTAQHRIMSIDINSQVATMVAGDGTASYADASGLTARFNQIFSMTTDGVDLYTAEVGNHLIRRVEVANNFRVTTLAGLPAVPGDATGVTGIGARFNLPHGIATDGRSLFIANHTAHTIRKLTDNGLVAYWPMNGTLADHSSAGNFVKTGTITGTVTATTGRFGEANGAYYFDGAQSSIGTPGGTQADTNFNSGNFTISLWVKPAAVQQEVSVNKDYDIISNLSGQYDFAIRYHHEVSSGLTIPANTPGQIIFIRYDGTNTPYCISGIRIDDGKFHHIAAQKSGGTLSMHIDGKKVCVASDTVGSITSIGPPRIGARDTGIANDFTGALAEVRIYARALNDGEINELAQDAGGIPEVGNGYNTAATGLLSHYQFNGVVATPSAPLGGNLSGGASLYAGKDGDASGALYYDTVPASYLTGGDFGLPVANAPRSLCAWFYPMSHPTTGHTNILSYGNTGAATNGQGLAIEVDSGKVKMSYHFGGGQSRFADWTPPLNTWTHFCGTYDGTTILMYVNGVSLPQTGAAFTPPLTTTTVGATGLGIGVWGGASKFNGKLDDLRIYNNALSAIAVRQLSTQVPIGLVARYDFSGDTKDVSGFGNDLTNGGAASSSDRFGVAGGAYHFNGTSNVMSNASTSLPFPVNTDNRTMCFWGRADQATAGVKIGVAYGNSSTNQAAQVGVNSLDTANPSTLGCAYGAPCSPGGFIAQNTWYNICMVVSGSNAQIYLNGGAAGSASSASAWATTRGPISIGSYSGNYWFPGDIDEVLIYNRALSANEIRTLTGYRPQQVSTWSVNNAATSLKFYLQPESATYANGSCSGGVNCVSAWRDTSGLNNNLTQAAAANRPIYDSVGINFQPALRFVDTSSTFVTGTCSADLSSQAMTVLAVLKEVNQSGNDGIFQNGGPANGKLIYLVDSPARPALFDLQANQLNFQPTGAAPYNASAESVLMSFDYAFTNPSASGNFYKNGASVASAVSTASGSYNCGAGTLDMGRYFWGAGGDYYDGYMGDFLYFNAALSNADRQIAECYLSAKYNINVGGNCQ